jgi:hypothetical protein
MFDRLNFKDAQTNLYQGLRGLVLTYIQGKKTPEGLTKGTKARELTVAIS